MTDPNTEHLDIGKRSASDVMRLERMGAFHQTRLSFMRALLRQLKTDQWQFCRTKWQLDSKGIGVAVYQAQGPDHSYSLICYANDLDPDKRSDRVIAEEWDATFTLFDGAPTEADIERLSHHVPKQEAGQCSQSELVLSRANRSVRLFDHVVERLSSGQQPDIEMLDSVGYLMRTTAVYGNGKFGLCDRECIANRPEFTSAFRTELLGVWLIRWFCVDIVEHLARVISPDSAVDLDRHLKRRLGVGNSTGLGMAPFLVTHPALLHTWIDARETALMRVRNIDYATQAEIDCFMQVFERMQGGLSYWRTDNPRQAERLAGLERDMQTLSLWLDDNSLRGCRPWDRVVNWAMASLDQECQELIVAMIIEPYGELVDDLADTMAIDEAPFQRIDGGMTIGKVRQIIEYRYSWALDIDYQQSDASARFWYVSEEKLEPRLGERYEEPGAKKEQPLAFGRDVKNLYQALAPEPHNRTIASFLMAFPEHRGAARRVQIVDRLPYAEIQDNLISSDMFPVDLLRCKLSFFGASRFDPRSDRWVRITMYQNAPYPNDFAESDADDWAYPLPG